jgi:hypothetical protein
VPVAPFFFAHGTTGVVASTASSALALFLIGAITTLFTGSNAVFAGFRQAAIGLLAAAVTYTVGRLIGVAVGAAESAHSFVQVDAERVSRGSSQPADPINLPGMAIEPERSAHRPACRTSLCAVFRDRSVSVSRAASHECRGLPNRNGPVTMRSPVFYQYGAFSPFDIPLSELNSKSFRPRDRVAPARPMNDSRSTVCPIQWLLI